MTAELRNICIKYKLNSEMINIAERTEEKFNITNKNMTMLEWIEDNTKVYKHLSDADKFVLGLGLITGVLNDK